MELVPGQRPSEGHLTHSMKPETLSPQLKIYCLWTTWNDYLDQKSGSETFSRMTPIWRPSSPAVSGTAYQCSALLIILLQYGLLLGSKYLMLVPQAKESVGTTGHQTEDLKKYYTTVTLE